MIEVLLVLGLVWLLVLTVAFLGVVRHLGAVAAANVGAAPRQGGALFETDGPWIPSDLPERAVTAFRTHRIQTDNVTVTFFSSRCGNCLEMAESVVAASDGSRDNVFLVTGSDPEPVAEMKRVLTPASAPILSDPDAHDIVKSLDINSTPFTFRVTDGQVVAKAFLADVSDYLRVANGEASESTPDTSEGAAQTEKLYQP